MKWRLSRGIGSAAKATGIVLVLLGTGFTCLRYATQRAGPTDCARRFIKAARANDTTGMRRCTSRSARRLVVPDFLSAPGVGYFLQGEEFRVGTQYTLKVGSTSREKVEVRLIPGPKPTHTFNVAVLPPQLRHGVPLIVVREGGRWRIDLLETNMVLAMRTLGDLKSRHPTTLPGTPPPWMPPPPGMPPLPPLPH